MIIRRRHPIMFRDGVIANVIEKIKEKVLTFNAQIQQLPTGKKILLIISKLITLLRVLMAVKHVKNFWKTYSKIRQTVLELDKKRKELGQQTSSSVEGRTRVISVIFSMLQFIVDTVLKTLAKAAEKAALKGTQWESLE